MPDIMNHYFLADAVLNSLPEKISICREVFDVACIGPDIWFSYRFWMPPMQKGIPSRGGEMHHSRTGAFLEQLLKAAQENRSARTELFSYLAGFLCHYALDRAAHPYIIYRAGEYLGTPETKKLRGNHGRMERSLDLRSMKKRGVTLRQRPMNRIVLRMRRFPVCMVQPLGQVLEKVYGWENAGRDLNRALADQRRFYMLACDPRGRVDRLLRKVDHGQLGLDLTSYSYFGKEADDLDTANTDCREWRHPQDSSLVCTSGFDEMFEKARADAVQLIGLAQECLDRGGNPAGLFGNFSYETGFDCDDPRNMLTPVCNPFPFV